MRIAIGSTHESKLSAVRRGYVGLEGGFHTLSIENTEHTLLRGWVCVTDGEWESFGSTS